MPKSVSRIRKALSAAHLQAIGLVAAHWSELELTLLWALSKTAGIGFVKTVTLAGSQNVTAWCEMLSKLTGQPLSKGSPLGKLKQQIADAQVQRNQVVHAAWHSREEVRGGLLGEIAPKPMGAKDVASGTGVPKRGKSPLITIEFTAPEMRKVAAEIAAIEQSVHEWVYQYLQTQQTRAGRPLLSPAPTQANNKLLALLLHQQSSTPSEHVPGSSIAA